MWDVGASVGTGQKARKIIAISREGVESVRAGSMRGASADLGPAGTSTAAMAWPGWP
jgi:hypothetical protein